MVTYDQLNRFYRITSRERERDDDDDDDDDDHDDDDHDDDDHYCDDNCDHKDEDHYCDDDIQYHQSLNIQYITVKCTVPYCTCSTATTDALRELSLFSAEHMMMRRRRMNDK